MAIFLCSAVKLGRQIFTNVLVSLSVSPVKNPNTMPSTFRAFSKKKPTPLPPLPIHNLNPIETFDFDNINSTIFQNQTLNILNQFPLYKPPFKQAVMCNKGSIHSYFCLKFVKEPYEIMPIYGWFNYRLLGILVDNKIHVVDKQGFACVPERITRDKEISYVSCGVGPENVGFNYPMMCKAIERLSEGVKDGNGDEYAKDLSRLVHVTSRSSIYPEMRELVMDAFDGDKQLFVRPKPSLIHLFREWDSISNFIRAGGVGDLLIGGRSYRMDDFRLMVSLINSGVYKGDENFNAENFSSFGGLPAKSELCYPEIHPRNLMLLVDRFDDQSPDLRAKVDRSALAGKNVGGCVKGIGEADKRANTCDNKIVDNSKGKLFKGDENFIAENFSSFGGLPAKSELCYPEIHPRNLKLLVDRFDDQSPDLKAKVDRSALAGKNVGGCVKGKGEADKRANTSDNKIVDNSKGKLTNVESSGTAANKWNKKGSTSASKGTWNTPAEEETRGSVGEVSSRETGYFARNCSLGAVGSKSGGHGSGSIGRALCTRMP